MTEILEALTNDSSTYFWFYSTIIQALAAMIAVVGMFFVYMFEVESRRVANKISDLHYKLAHAQVGKAMHRFNTALDRTRSMSVSILIDEVKKELESFQNPKYSDIDKWKDPKKLEDLKQAYLEYEETRENVQSSKKYIKKPFIFAGCAIAFSILMLPLSESFATYQLIWRYEGLVPLFIVLFFSCFAIWIIIRAVVKVATRESF